MKNKMIHSRLVVGIRDILLSKHLQLDRPQPHAGKSQRDASKVTRGMYVEHCEASVSKQCTVALNCYVAIKGFYTSEVSNHSTQAMHGI